MIAQNTIDAVFEAADIVDIISQFVDLKRSGSNYLAKSPFSEEKTASFNVVPSKGIFKDFSSGKGGNFVEFLMQHQGWDYPTAITWTAKHYSIPVEYTELKPEQREKAEKKDIYRKINRAASLKFVENARQLAGDHKASNQLSRFAEETLTEFQIGYTGDNPKFIYELTAEKGLVADAEAISLVSLHQSNYSDFFRERIIFPIHDRIGNVVGFGGRALGDEKPKYLNSKESDLFHKGKNLYGYFHAQKEISNTDTAYLTEGYTDVIAWHECGIINTVATLGTALTEDHVRQLKKVCKTIVIVRDGDAAGRKAAIRDMEMIIQNGLQAGIILLPEGKDPYDIAHDMEIDDPISWAQDHTTDALTHFAKEMYSAATDPMSQGEALNQIAEWLGMIGDSFIREQYRKQLAKEIKVKAKDLKDREPVIEKKDKRTSYGVATTMHLPEGVTEEEVIKYGFYGIVEPGSLTDNNTGYYFHTGGNGFVQVSNFVLTPLFHKYEMEDNTRVFRIENGIMGSEIIEIPSSALISLEQFRKFLFDKGAYFFDGSKVHLDKINKKYLFEFPKAFELKTLGWQNEGFFAFYNCVYNGQLEYYDEAGLIKHDNQFFFSPAASIIYSDVRKDDDLFENDRYLSYQESPITFEEWMKLMKTVYEDHCYAAIPFVFIALFRDIVFKVDNNCPFLYFYGQSKSGKSKCAESIMNLFFKEMPAFQLNGGTDFAFANRLERFRNVPVFLNEFDDNVIKDEWFQMIKGAYDGEGRERGRGGSKKKTEIQKVNSALLLVGQYLSTKDDNSILSRSILRVFKINYNRSNEQTDAYNKLKEMESKGLSSIITNILKHRSTVKEKYYALFFDTFKELSTIIRARKETYEERVCRNYASLLTMVKLFNRVYQFPWDVKEYQEWCISEIVKLSGTIAETDVLQNFWTFVGTMADHKEIMEDRDYKLKWSNTLRITKGKTDEEIDLGNEQKHILWIRLKEVQINYAAAVRKTGGNPIDFTSLKSYMENRDYYLGYVHRERIGKKVVSCYALDYEAIDVDLAVEQDDTPVPVPPPGNLPDKDTKDEDLPF